MVVNTSGSWEHTLANRVGSLHLVLNEAGCKFPLSVPVGLCQGNAKAELLSFDEEFISTVLIQSVMDSGKVRG